MSTLLWLCGQFRTKKKWEFQGVYSTRELAVRACRNEMYFIVPVPLNCACPDETVYFREELIYPLAK